MLVPQSRILECPGLIGISRSGYLTILHGKTVIWYVSLWNSAQSKRHSEFRDNNYTAVKNSRQRNLVMNDCNQTGQKKVVIMYGNQESNDNFHYI